MGAGPLCRWTADEAQLACLDFKVFSQGQFTALLWHFPSIKLPYHFRGFISAGTVLCSCGNGGSHWGAHSTMDWACWERPVQSVSPPALGRTWAPSGSMRRWHTDVQHVTPRGPGEKQLGGTQSPTCFWSVLAKEKEKSPLEEKLDECHGDTPGITSDRR